MVDTSTLCRLVNNTGVDVLVAMQLADNETPSEASTVSADRNFEILPPGGSGNLLHSGGADTVVLNRNYRTDDGSFEPELVYQLLICKPEYLSPVVNLTVVQQWDPDEGPNFYKDQVLSADNLTKQQQAVTFFQTISAYPDSQLAHDYVNSMTRISEAPARAPDGDDNAANAVFNSMEESVKAFFAATKNYQLLSLDSIRMVELYFDLFPFGWAQYKDALSYFLYGSDGKKTVFAGTISFTKNGPPDITKINCGYRIVFTPSVEPDDTSKTTVDSGAALSLVYHEGIFVEDAKADLPRIALKGLFQLKRNFTCVSTDTKIIPVLSGSIDGMIVVGFDEAQATNPDDSTMDWLRSLFAPKTAEGIFNAVTQIVSALMMLHFAGGLIIEAGQWLRNKIANRKPVKLEELREKINSLELEGRQLKIEIFRKINRETNTSFPENSAASVEQSAAANNVIQGEVGKIKLNQKIRELSTELSELQIFAEGNDLLCQKLADAGEELLTAADALAGVEPGKLNNMLETEVRPAVSNIIKNISSLSTEVAESVSKAMKANVEQSEQNISRVQSELEDQRKSSEEQRSEESRPDLEVEPEPLP
jgi:hypothetical protein